MIQYYFWSKQYFHRKKYAIDYSALFSCFERYNFLFEFGNDFTIFNGNFDKAPYYFCKENFLD